MTCKAPEDELLAKNGKTVRLERHFLSGIRTKRSMRSYLNMNPHLLLLDLIVLLLFSACFQALPWQAGEKMGGKKREKTWGGVVILLRGVLLVND